MIGVALLGGVLIRRGISGSIYRFAHPRTEAISPRGWEGGGGRVGGWGVDGWEGGWEGGLSFGLSSSRDDLCCCILVW